MIQVKGYAAQSPTTDPAPWNFERRDVGPHDVQIEINFCGVCHSDLHQIRNEWFPGVFPMVPGHEIVGRIVQVGDHVQKFTVGELAGVGCMCPPTTTFPCTCHFLKPAASTSWSAHRPNRWKFRLSR